MTAGNPRNKVARKKPKRKTYDRVLLVCEGKQTEPNYFLGLSRHFKLNDPNIKVVGVGGDPMKVVDEGKRLQREESNYGEKFDKVYCVFDRDEHDLFKKASSLAKQNNMHLARSWPCFEYWILLHYCFSRRPYVRVQDRSPADHCMRELRNYWKDYAKAEIEIFGKLNAMMAFAMKNAKKAEKDARATQNRNPSTEVHKLVTYLEKLTKN